MHLSDYELVKVASGAWSVRDRSIGETFHPVIGPVAEAEALYLHQMRVPQRVEAAGQDGFTVWDIGLGAGANILTVLRALHPLDARVRVESFDHTDAPLRFALGNAEALGYLAGFEQPASELLRDHRVEFRFGACTIDWRLHLADFPTWLERPLPEPVPGPEAILFDAFSPARNPAMWTLPLFTRLRQRVPEGRVATMATYSRSTLLRTTLLLAGFFVGAGEATGEKEETTLAATDPSHVRRPLDASWLQRALRSTSAEPLHEPVYRQRPLTEPTRTALLAHPQFQAASPLT